MSTMASQLISIAIIYSSVYLVADQRKHQSSASPAFVRGIHGWPGNPPHKGPVTRKMFPFDCVIMFFHWSLFYKSVYFVALVIKYVVPFSVTRGSGIVAWAHYSIIAPLFNEVRPVYAGGNNYRISFAEEPFGNQGLSIHLWVPHLEMNIKHDDVIKWKHFPRNWPFVRGIHRSRRIPHTKASDAELWCFLWSASE